MKHWSRTSSGRLKRESSSTSLFVRMAENQIENQHAQIENPLVRVENLVNQEENKSQHGDPNHPTILR